MQWVSEIHKMAKKKVVVKSGITEIKNLRVKVIDNDRVEGMIMRLGA